MTTYPKFEFRVVFESLQVSLFLDHTAVVGSFALPIGRPPRKLPIFANFVCETHARVFHTRCCIQVARSIAQLDSAVHTQIDLVLYRVNTAQLYVAECYAERRASCHSSTLPSSVPLHSACTSDSVKTPLFHDFCHLVPARRPREQHRCERRFQPMASAPR